MAFRASLLSISFPLLLCLGAGLTHSALPAQPRALAVDELEAVMEKLDENLEAVVAAIDKKDAAAGLELMTKLQQGCITAKTMTPPKTKTVGEKDKALFLAGYRKQLMHLLKAMADLEIALIDGDFAKATETIEQIDKLKKSGHDDFKKLPRKTQ